MRSTKHDKPPESEPPVELLSSIQLNSRGEMDMIHWTDYWVVKKIWE